MKDATNFGFSRFWDIYLPLGMSSIPAGCFKLMGMAAAGLDQPGAGIANWQFVAMLVLETIGIVGMAVVVLIRLEMGMTQLNVASGGNRKSWRRNCLLISMGCLTLFDIFLNLGSAFTDATLFIVVAVFWYLLYVLGIRLTFARLQNIA